MAESTMNQSQQAFEQLFDLQRNMAKMTLSAIKWQEVAQQQGLEMTKSLLENTPGPQFTESMMESYLQGMEAMMPEMEQVMERGFEAAAQPQIAQMEQMGSQLQAMGQQPGHGRTSEHGTSQQTPAAQTGGQQFDSRGAGQPTQTQAQPQPQPTPQTQQTQPTPQTQTAGQGPPSGRPQQEYPETGEWVSPAEYGGESAGTTGIEREPLTATPTHSGRSQPTGQFGGQPQQSGPDRSRQESGRAPPTGQIEQQRQGEQPQQSRSRQPQETQRTPTGGRTRGGGGSDQPTRQQRPSQQQTGQRRSPEGYSQRIDTDRSEQSERGRPLSQTQQGHTEQSTMRDSRSERTDERDRSKRHRTDEMSAMEEMNISTKGSQRTTGNRGEDRTSDQE